LQAIGELIALGEQEGFGITFNPDETGWTVGYLRGQQPQFAVDDFDRERRGFAVRSTYWICAVPTW
jgi:hypothetical protein